MTDSDQILTVARSLVDGGYAADLHDAVALVQRALSDPPASS